jgi:hypothetical protein
MYLRQIVQYVYYSVENRIIQNEWDQDQDPTLFATKIQLDKQRWLAT